MNLDRRLHLAFQQSLHNGCVELGRDPLPEVNGDEPWLRLTMKSHSWAEDHRVRFDVPARIRVVATAPLGSEPAIANWVVVGMEAGFVQIHDVHTGAQVRNKSGSQLCWQAHDGWVTGLAVNAAGYISTSGWDGTIAVWKPEDFDGTDKQATVWDAKRHDGIVNGVAFSPTGERLASVGADGMLMIWSITDDTDVSPISSVSAYNGWAKAVAWLSDTSIVTGGTDGILKLWEIGPGSNELLLIAIAKGTHTQEIRTIAAGGDNLFASGGRDKTVVLWERGPGTKLTALWRGEAHSNHVNSICWCGSKFLASASDDRMVLLWHIHPFTDSGGLALPAYRRPVHEHFVNSIAYECRSDQIVSAGLDRTVTVMPVSLGQQDPSTHAHTDWLECVVLGERVITGGNDRFAKVFEPDSKGELQLKWHHKFGDWVNAAAWSPTNNNVIAVGSSDGVVSVWDVSVVESDPASHRAPKRHGKVHTDHSIMNHRGHAAWISSIAFSPDGTRVASGSGDTMVGVWAPFGPKKDVEVWREHGHQLQVNCCSFSDCGNYLASGSKDRITVWDVNAQQPIWEGPGEQEGRTVAWGANPWLASGSFDGHVKIWGVGRSAKHVHSIKISSGEVRALTWNRARNLVAASTDDRMVALIDPFTGKIKCRFYTAAGGLSLYFTNADRELHVADNGGGTGMPRIYRLCLEGKF